jgi:uncharacterized membrane protein
MSPSVRKLALTVHVASSVGWLGGVACFLVLALVGLNSRDAQTVSAVDVGLRLIGWYVLVPGAIASLVTGVVQSIGTEWGLFRHYWVFIKLLLTVGATALLLLHMQLVTSLGQAAAAGTIAGDALRAARTQVAADAGFALVLLVAITALSVYKPWGLTPWAARAASRSSNGIPRPRRTAAPLGLYVLVGMAVFVVVVALVHLAGGGLHR